MPAASLSWRPHLTRFKSVKESKSPPLILKVTTMNATQPFVVSLTLPSSASRVHARRLTMCISLIDNPACTSKFSGWAKPPAKSTINPRGRPIPPPRVTSMCERAAIKLSQLATKKSPLAHTLDPSWPPPSTTSGMHAYRSGTASYRRLRGLRRVYKC